MNENQAQNGIAEKTVAVPALVSRVIALGYCDGPTNGILECEAPGGPVYKFDLLDLLYAEDGLDLRIVSLAPLPTESISDFVSVMAPYQAPHWPLWCPLWSFPSEDAQRAAERDTDQILDRAADIESVIALVDMPGRIVSVRALLAHQVSTISDWPSFLGVSKQPPWVNATAVAP
jgi:hypothetical protein